MMSIYAELPVAFETIGNLSVSIAETIVAPSRKLHDSFEH